MADTVILSGIEASNALYDSLHARIGVLKEKGVTPGLAAILVGENPASQIYVRNKTKKFDSLGLKSDIYRLPENTKEEVGVISPGGVGFDINCGVRLLRTDLVEQDIRAKQKEIMEEVQHFP